MQQLKLWGCLIRFRNKLLQAKLKGFHFINKEKIFWKTRSLLVWIRAREGEGRGAPLREGSSDPRSDRTDPTAGNMLLDTMTFACTHRADCTTLTVKIPLWFLMQFWMRNPWLAYSQTSSTTAVNPTGIGSIRKKLSLNTRTLKKAYLSNFRPYAVLRYSRLSCADTKVQTNQRLYHMWHCQACLITSFQPRFVRHPWDCTPSPGIASKTEQDSSLPAQGCLLSSRQGARQAHLLQHQFAIMLHVICRHSYASLLIYLNSLLLN